MAGHYKEDNVKNCFKSKLDIAIKQFFDLNNRGMKQFKKKLPI